MKRVARQPTRLGAIDLASDIGQELNLPLSRISEAFSFDEATQLGLKDIRLLVGRRAEKMFEYVVASLGHAELIHQEDSAGSLFSGADVQAPDYFVALKSGERYLVEVKHARTETFDKPVNFGRKYLASLKRYAHLRGYTLAIAVYWKSLRRWTINKVEDFETQNGTINLRFMDAMQRSLAGSFGDRMIGVVPPLVCRVHAKRDAPRSIDANGQAVVTIGALSFFSEGREIVDELEKQVAFYLLFRSSWVEKEPVAKMDGDKIDYIELSIEPRERTEGQEFEIIGTTADMVTKQFEWLTTANDAIVRLTPQLTPEQMAPAFDDSYRGKVLRMWLFNLQPNYEPLVRKEA